MSKSPRVEGPGAGVAGTDTEVVDLGEMIKPN